MNKKSLLLASLMLFSLSAQADRYAYGYSHYTACDSDIREEYGKYCMVILSPIYHEKRKLYAGYDSKTHKEWRDSTRTQFPLLSGFVGNFHEVLRDEDEDDAKKDRNKDIRDWQNQDYKIIYFSTNE